jgi:hypothetical protein
MRNNEWITTIIEGKMEGKAGKGRSRKPYMKQIIEARPAQAKIVQ